jgi:hypothetical protein
MTTSGAAQTVGPRDDHAVGLVTPLHWSDVDVIQRGHYHQQCCPHRLVCGDGLAGRCRHHEFSQELVRGQCLQFCSQQDIVQARPRPAIQPHDVIHPGVHPCGAVGPVLERCEVL